MPRSIASTQICSALERDNYCGEIDGIKIRMANTVRLREVTRHPMDVIPQYDRLNIALDGLKPKQRLVMAA